MLQIEVMKTTGILYVFRGFHGEKLRQKIRRFAKEGFLEVPICVKMGGSYMIRFDRLWETMALRNMSTYQLREWCGIDSKTIRRLRANDNIETKTLNKLCTVLNCQLEDIAQFVPDDTQE